jgi:hypothetical protein
MMEGILDVVTDEIGRRAPGVAMHGTSRLGKSRAISYLRAKIAEMYPTITIVKAIMVTRRTTSDTRFFKGLAVDFAITADGDGDDLRTAIVRQILINCSNSNDLRVLILLDEAQRIRPIEYSYLIDLTNHLENLGISPTVILCAQSELLDQRNILISQRRRDVIGRFLENPIGLSGIASLEQLQSVMRQYDDPTAMQFPPKSGFCITAAYAPAKYKKGVRISNYAGTLWEAIVDVAKPIVKTPVIGMQSLTKTIEMALIELATDEGNEISLDKDFWLSLLQEAGYSRTLMMTHEIEMGKS